MKQDWKAVFACSRALRCGSVVVLALFLASSCGRTSTPTNTLPTTAPPAINFNFDHWWAIAFSLSSGLPLHPATRGSPVTTTMDDTLVRIWEHLIGRLSGPLTFRLLLQPTMSTLFAVRDGVRDARSGRSPFLGTILGSRANRRRPVREGLMATGKLAGFAILLDFAYQLIVFHRIYPVEAIDVAFLLAILPYFVLRGPVNRIASRSVRPEKRAADQR